MKNSAYIERPFELKSVKEDGTFEGVASPFGEIDSYRDVVQPGAFTKSLAQYHEKNRKVPMLWQHDTRQPIGIYSELKETPTQLIVSGACNMEVQRGRECHALMKQGALSGLSIGYDTVRDEWDTKGETRKLHEVNLWEISPVTFPAADSARVTMVKSLQEIDSLSDLEGILRDAGFSKAEATAFTGRVKAIAMRSESASAHAESLKRALSILTS